MDQQSAKKEDGATSLQLLDVFMHKCIRKVCDDIRNAPIGTENLCTLVQWRRNVVVLLGTSWEYNFTYIYKVFCTNVTTLHHFQGTGFCRETDQFYSISLFIPISNKKVFRIFLLLLMRKRGRNNDNIIHRFYSRFFEFHLLTKSQQSGKIYSPWNPRLYSCFCHIFREQAYLPFTEAVLVQLYKIASSPKAVHTGIDDRNLLCW